MLDYVIIIIMELLKAGQQISIFFQKNEKIVEISSIISQVLDDRLIVDLPQYFMRYIEFLESGKELTVKVFSKMGTVDFNSIIISSPLEEAFTIELDYNAMRLTPSEEIPFIGAIEELHIKSSDISLKVKTFEISSEYIKFNSDSKIEVGKNFDCELILPKKYGTIKFRITITENDPVYDSEYTATYYCMSEDDRQTLLYYMYLYSNNSN